VVEHFLLLGDAATGFAAGEFDCVGVLAPFTVQPLECPTGTPDPASGSRRGGELKDPHELAV
jgi:hypothetical protein